MPEAAKCPSCGASLSETSVLALAPACGHCGTVITKVGGTFGLTSAYGVNDPAITRKRVEADLAVLCEYRNNYVGMMEACRQQLNWGVERYAKPPNPPELLSLQPMPSLTRLFVPFYGGPLAYLWRCYKAKAANGNRPLENARRQKAYEEAVAESLRAAESFKAAQDHRLRIQIRELEGLIGTVGDKARDVRGILATL